MKKILNLNLPVFASFLTMAILFTGCKKDDDDPYVPPVVVNPTAPKVTAGKASWIGENSVTLNGTVNAGKEDTEIVFEYGPTTSFEFSVNATPDVISGDEDVEVRTVLTDLTAGTLYYYRILAENSIGSTYGGELTFTTFSVVIFNPDVTYGSVTDEDGNIYKTIETGTQTWMAENLRTTKYNDGTAIPLVSDETEWAALTTPGYSWYNNDPDFNKPVYGALYNWYAANSANICPTGWHTATNDEYDAMEVSIGLAQADINIWGWRGTDHGSKMKNTTGWNAGENGTNTSGFSALPGGYRFYSDGLFAGQNAIGYWWTATEHDAARGWYRRLDGNNTAVYRASTDKRAGKAIRCVKD